ncbi:hypothetical protein SAMN02745355_1017 [Picrophilus oshimae DSM 9789]|uniref:Uncharacterized protein n=2 Tax=Picrophilus oshimae TaxID=46632 RepID=A0A8G2FX33_PICTO|nr:hypothetical protein SAMN02745355_1017 [Picrophilus oshimae DSM 9789]
MRGIFVFAIIIIMCMPALSLHDSHAGSPYVSIVNKNENDIIKCNNNSITFMTKCQKPSYLRFDYPSGNYTEYSFGISWNNCYDYGRTENSILLSENNETLLNISYGPYLCYNTLICNSDYASINLSEMNHIYYFKIFISNNSKHVYLAFNNDVYNIQLKKIYTGNLSIMFGGQYSDQTIYNYKSIPYNIFNNSLNDYKCISFNVDKNIENAFLARSLNTVFYINNKSLIAYNYYNKSYYGKLNNVSGSLFYQDSGNITLFLIKNNISMVTISKTNAAFKIRYFKNNGYIYAYRDSNNIIFINKTAIYYNENIININGTVIGAYHDKSLFIIYKSRGSIYLSKFLNNEIVNIYYINVSKSTIEYINDGSALWPLISSNGIYINMLPKMPYISVSPLILYNGTSFFYNSYLYSSSGKTKIYKNISIDGGAILSFKNSTFYIYYKNDYLSAYHPEIDNITVKKYFDYNLIYLNVSSYLPYRSVLSFNSRSFNINKFMKLNLSNVGQGIYNAFINVTNTAGYTCERSLKIYSLKYPGIYVYPENNSYVIYNQTVRFYVSEFNLKYINVKYRNVNLTFNGNSSFNLSLGNYTGNITLRFTTLDKYNLLYYKNVTYHVMAIPVMKTNIKNNEYFNSGKINITWNKIKNATSYIVKINNNTYKTFNDYINVSLKNGLYNVSFYIILRGNITVKGPEYDITVITYKPGIIYHVNTDNLSFYGNSDNNTMNISIKVNMPAELNASIIFNNKTIFTYNSKNFTNSYYINITGNSGNFHGNGIYILILNLSGINGLKSKYTYYFYVNNSIPKVYKNCTYYINKPYLNISLNKDYKYYINNEYFNGSIHLTLSNKIYEFNVKYYSKTGNYNSFHIIVYYFTETPIITVYHRISNNTLYMRIYTHYPVKPYKLIIDYMNKTRIIVNPGRYTYFNITFNKNGLYRINITAESLFKTESRVEINAGINYFIKIYKYSIDYNNGILSLILNGINTKNVSISWFLNGKYIGSGSIIKYKMPLGYNNITARLSFDGKTVYYTRYIIVTGSPVYYILIILIILASFIAYYKLRYKNKNIGDFINSMNGKPLSVIYKTCRRHSISRHALKKEIKNLRLNGIIEIEEDMDGKKYLVIKTQK